MCRTYIVDTNVILVANQMHGSVSPNCIAECSQKLQNIMEVGRIALDSGWLILKEYQEKLDSRRAPQPGDAFVKWILRNTGSEERCDFVDITAHDERVFEEFPDAVELKTFDVSDRKFVAVAVAHPKDPKILQACDSKWLSFEDSLKLHGVEVEFICLEDIQAFHAKKTQA